MARVRSFAAIALPVAVGLPPRPWFASSAWLAHPSAVFLLLSVLFGTLLAVLTPPLRGPDEAAHFLRAYGLAQGDIVPSTTDGAGRKGIFLPAHVYDGFALLEASHAKERTAFGGRAARLTDGTRLEDAAAPAVDQPAVFVRYEGSEGYNPLAYLAPAAAGLAARLAGLDFATTLYLMRFAGLAAMSALVAYAIAIAPCLRWAFLAIAMLPAALYGRAVVSADGATLATAMVVTALCLRGAYGRIAPASRQALWMALCVLAKPPQLAFILLPAMQHSWRALPRQWRMLALIVLPAVAATVLWHMATAADAGAWRLVELTGRPAEQFDPVWKLGFMLERPLHFVQAAIATLGAAPELWRQLIGVLGLFDTVLRPWVYPVLSLLVAATVLTPLQLARTVRYRVATVAGLTALGYLLAVFLIFYLVWTPIDADQVWGVQGRYFIPALPLLALVIAALLPRGLSESTAAWLAVGSAILAGVASAEAIFRVEWMM